MDVFDIPRPLYPSRYTPKLYILSGTYQKIYGSMWEKQPKCGQARIWLIFETLIQIFSFESWYIFDVLLTSMDISDLHRPLYPSRYTPKLYISSGASQKIYGSMLEKTPKCGQGRIWSIFETFILKCSGNP